MGCQKVENMVQARASVMEGVRTPEEDEEVLLVTFDAKESGSDPRAGVAIPGDRSRCLDALRRWIRGEDEGLAEWLGDSADCEALFQAARAQLLRELAEYEDFDLTQVEPPNARPRGPLSFP